MGWYDTVNGAAPMAPPVPSVPVYNRPNPFQIMQAMQNPSAFVRWAFPDIPNEIANDPNQILSYVQRSRGITNQQIQNMMQMAGSMMPGFHR